ncbi:MAG: hypothetical protein A2252_05640 [Elusimicrobia bacterium RIFOXYA2_FULL_39_19]|nr:MAG: hypothetical protein A2252_05640 [Elusimicrobia bacterium RIFOXYA2_FULL_39_19]
MTLSPPKRPKIVLVLSGGGARGLAHIGVLKVLEEEGIPIDAVAGTSVGSLAAALYCAGIPIGKIEMMAEDIGWSKLSNLSTPSLVNMLITERLLSNEKLEKYIADNIGGKQFHELKIPFACVATDIRTGEKIIFTEGNVAQAARASATIPGVFEPVEYRHRMLVDGGLVDNMPTDIAKMFNADIIIAVDISADLTQTKVSSVIMTFSQALFIQGTQLSRESLKSADIVINPQLKDVAIHELWRSRECMDAGILAARKSIPQLKKLIMDKTLEKTFKKN